MEMSSAEKKSNINNILNDMHNYQKLNGIHRRCLTNAQTLYDYYDGFKARAFICVGDLPDGRKYVVDKHMALTLDDKIFDPSYEVASKKNVKYYITYDEYRKSDPKPPSFNKEQINGFLKFINYANDMNNGKEVFSGASLEGCCGDDYYGNQLNYLNHMIHRRSIALL